MLGIFIRTTNKLFFFFIKVYAYHAQINVIINIDKLHRTKN